MSERSGLPTVAVVIPAFNAERFLRDAIESVLAQERLPDEIVVVDDGSTDGTAAAAAAFGSAVRVLAQANGGVAAARNAGIGATRSDLVALLDADDLWPRASLAARLAVLERTPSADVVVGRVATFVDGAVPSTAAPVDAAGFLASACLVRRRAFERVGLFDPSLRVAEFVDWCDRARGLDVEFAHLSEVVLLRRLRPGSLASTSGPGREDYLRALRGALRRRRASP